MNMHECANIHFNHYFLKINLRKREREEGKEGEREKPWHTGMTHKPTKLASQGKSLLSSLWGLHPDGKLLDHMVILFLIL